MWPNPQETVRLWESSFSKKVAAMKVSSFEKVAALKM